MTRKAKKNRTGMDMVFDDYCRTLPLVTEFSRLPNLEDRVRALAQERERLQAIVDRLENDLGTISDKLGSVIRTIPSGSLSRTYLEAIDDSNRIAFLAWKSTAVKPHNASEKARAT